MVMWMLKSKVSGYRNYETSVLFSQLLCSLKLIQNECFKVMIKWPWVDSALKIVAGVMSPSGEIHLKSLKNFHKVLRMMSSQFKKKKNQKTYEETRYYEPDSAKNEKKKKNQPTYDTQSLQMIKLPEYIERFD